MPRPIVLMILGGTRRRRGRPGLKGGAFVIAAINSRYFASSQQVNAKKGEDLFFWAGTSAMLGFMAVGHRINTAALLRLRLRAGMGQEDLAKAVGMHSSRINKIENGRDGLPRISTITKLAAALGCEVDDLLADAQIVPGSGSQTITAHVSERLADQFAGLASKQGLSSSELCARLIEKAVAADQFSGAAVVHRNAPPTRATSPTGSVRHIQDKGR
jgi:transcriptional regulator with XRE-family HTH domain